MKKSKVHFFKPVINFIIDHIRIIICTVLVITVSILSPLIYKAVNYFFTIKSIPISKFQEIIITAFLGFLLPVLYAGFSNIHKNRKHSIVKIKRNVYRNLYQLSISESTPRWLQKIVRLIIQVFYYQKREPLKEQQIVVHEILTKLESHASSKNFNRVFWIQGSPYSGKTTTVLNLFIDLISKKEYSDLFEKLDGKIIYLDLGRDDFDIEQLLYDYNLGKYENQLLVLDNLHKVSSTNCFNIIYKIILDIQAFSIIILMRKPSEFLSDTDQIVKLTKIIGDKGFSYALPVVSKHDFSSYRETAFGLFCEQFSLSTNDYSNNAVIVHLSSLYMRRKVDFYSFLPQIQSFLCKDDDLNDFDRKMAAIISVSLFNGSLSIEVLDSCNINFKYGWKPFLHKLLDLGFLINYPDASKKYYYFHENIAKFYFQKSYSMPFYKNLYQTYFQKLLNYYLRTQNKLLTFLYSILLSEDHQNHYLFDEIIINANFVNLYGEINFLLMQDESRRINFYRELGILCDRIGKLQEAKDYYIRYLESSKNIDAFYKLVQIDHEYIYDYPQIAREAQTSQDKYYTLLHNYWCHHINMHDGNFDFESYMQMLGEGQTYCAEILAMHPYDGIHLLRRLYFDLFRVYYLAGVLNPLKLKMAIEQGSQLKECLSVKLDEFEAYYIKFVVAQFLGQDILFSLAFQSKSLSRENYDFILKEYTELEYEEMHNVSQVATEAIRLYKIAINMMEQIGDKTAVFIQYHMYGTKLALISDGNFSECEQFYEDYMGFATRENDVEYQSYAELYKLKMLMIKMSSPAIINSSINLKELAKQAQKKVQLTRAYQHLCNTKNSNVYAEIRLDLYEAILNFLSKKIKVQQFKALVLKIQKSVEMRNYHRERVIIKYIEERQFNPSFEDIRIIITYYPIITQ